MSAVISASNLNYISSFFPCNLSEVLCSVLTMTSRMNSDMLPSFLASISEKKLSTEGNNNDDDHDLYSIESRMTPLEKALWMRGSESDIQGILRSMELHDNGVHTSTVPTEYKTEVGVQRSLRELSIPNREVNSWTPLHLAVINGVPSTETVEYMIRKYPFALDMRDVFGKTPRDYVMNGMLSNESVQKIMTPTKQWVEQIIEDWKTRLSNQSSTPGVSAPSLQDGEEGKLEQVELMATETAQFVLPDLLMLELQNMKNEIYTRLEKLEQDLLDSLSSKNETNSDSHTNEENVSDDSGYMMLMTAFSVLFVIILFFEELPNIEMRDWASMEQILNQSKIFYKNLCNACSPTKEILKPKKKTADVDMLKSSEDTLREELLKLKAEMETKYEDLVRKITYLEENIIVEVDIDDVPY